MPKRMSQFITVNNTDDTTFIPIVTGEQPVNRKIAVSSLTQSIIDGVSVELTNINNNITGETSARISGDLTLNGLITGETSARINNDLILFSLITGNTGTTSHTGLTDLNLDLNFQHITNDDKLAFENISQYGVKSDLSIQYILALTQEEYNSIEVKDEHTLYFIKQL